MKHYDYIIAGAGCAGLSLLTRLIASQQFTNKKILLVDKTPKTQNDHTWCFWEDKPGFFESVVHRQWDKLFVHTSEQSKLLNIYPYNYKMIRAADFYNYCFAQIEQAAVDVVYGEITSLTSTGDHAQLTVAGEVYTANYIFSSLLTLPLEKQPGKHYLLQHFKGWMIETTQPYFDTSAATLMDFRVPQQLGACFVYILPVAENKAMLECTFFSKELAEPATYDTYLREYISTNMPGIEYHIVEEEYGIIPMTNHAFEKDAGRIIKLGTAGGYTKPSSGYTFQFIQAHTEKLTKRLAETGGPLMKTETTGRFYFYDTVLLNVLANNRYPGYQIFGKLFFKNQPQNVLRFLQNESTLTEEIKIINTLPKWPFLKASFHEIKHVF